MIRHFTASGYVIHAGKVLLHWHQKVKALLPPGGHLDVGEDPVQTVLREIEEETGLVTRVIPSHMTFRLDYPTQITPPVTIMIEDIQDPDIGPHQHIDMIYFCHPVRSTDILKEGWFWISEEDIDSRATVVQRNGSDIIPAEDVRVLALAAFRASRAIG